MENNQNTIYLEYSFKCVVVDVSINIESTERVQCEREFNLGWDGGRPSENR